MTYWNHRVMKRKFETGDLQFGIHEVYYNDKDEVEAWTENPVPAVATNLKELEQTLEWMALALKKPALDYENGKEIRQKQIRNRAKKKPRKSFLKK